VLPRPFVFGPVSGGERAPLRFVAPMGAGPLLQEVLWRMLLRLSFIDPVFIAMQARATRILVTTPDTAACLFPRFRDKAAAGIAIGAPAARGESGGRTASPVRLLFTAPLHYANGGDIVAEIAAEIESRGRRYDSSCSDRGRAMPPSHASSSASGTCGSSPRTSRRRPNSPRCTANATWPFSRAFAATAAWRRSTPWRTACRSCVSTSARRR
jgi:hypothetical protein